MSERDATGPRARPPSIEETAAADLDIGSLDGDPTLAGDPTPAPPRTAMSASAPTPGEQIGRYIILQRVGAGGMGEVFAAYDPELDRKVAIKLLHADLGGVDTSAGRGRLLREAQAMARLTHPNTVTIHDVGEHRGRVFLAMEFVAGKTLGEWITTPRSSQEVVRVFAAAGRGLAAAHQKGMIHRDFKPDNVMLADDGRVLVMDFGLARAIDELDAVGSAAVDLKDPSTLVATSRTLVDSRTGPSLGGASSRLSTSLTRTGALTGTPAYMAPEQFRGSADARSDQFSFCVALYQALCGERPFAGESLAALVFQISQGNVRPPAPGRKVPTWLRRVVVRGLATDPAQRWPSMQALVEALEHDPARARRGIAVGLIGVLVCGVPLALAWHWKNQGAAQPPPVCTDSEAELAEIWSDTRRTSLREAMVATGLPYADRSADEVTRLLTRWSRMWIAGHRDACEATELHRSQSNMILDQRMRCLDRQRRHFAQVVDELEQVDASTLEQAVSRVESLPQVDRCSDLAYVALQVPPPEDPEVATKVDDLRERLARYQTDNAKLLLMKDALEQAHELEALRRSAEPLAYAPLLAEIDVQLGVRLKIGRKGEAAEQTLRRAYFTARRNEANAVAIEAAIQLMETVGGLRGRYTEALGWGDHAEVDLASLGDPLADAMRLRATASVRMALGDFAGAEADTRTSLEILQRELPGDALRIVYAHREHAAALLFLGRRDEASDELQRAREALVARLGPDHPELGFIDELLIIEALHRGESELARDRALALLELYDRAGMSADDPRRAIVLQNLGTAYRRLRDDAAARIHWQQALDLRERVFGPEHPDVADLIINLASVSEERSVEQKIDDIERAIAIYEKAGASHGIKAAAGHYNLSGQLWDLERYDEWREHIVKATELFSNSQGPASENALRARHDHADGLRILGKPNEAARLMEYSLELIRDYPDAKRSKGDPFRAETIGQLMMIELSRGNLARASELAREGAALLSNELPPLYGFRLRFMILQTRYAEGDASARADVLALQREVEATPDAFTSSAPEQLREWLKKHPR